jgi:dihydroorotate dehydrogenase (NAD+) catalytic subunit
LPFLKTLSPPIFVNIYGKRIEEYAEIANRLDDTNGVSGIEVNISCPNVQAGGIAFGVDPKEAEKVVRAVRGKTSKPLMVKLSPNVTDVTEIAESVESAGADSISLINTLTGMAIDIEARRPMLDNITGGLSGPAIKPIALRMVWQVAETVSIPVIGIGGITTTEDAVEFLLAGASAVQVGTTNFVNPKAVEEIIQGIEAYLAQKNMVSIKELIGRARQA